MAIQFYKVVRGTVIYVLVLNKLTSNIYCFKPEKYDVII